MIKEIMVKRINCNTMNIASIQNLAFRNFLIIKMEQVHQEDVYVLIVQNNLQAFYVRIFLSI